MSISAFPKRTFSMKFFIHHFIFEDVVFNGYVMFTVLMLHALQLIYCNCDLHPSAYQWPPALAVFSFFVR